MARRGRFRWYGRHFLYRFLANTRLRAGRVRWPRACFCLKNGCNAYWCFAKTLVLYSAATSRRRALCWGTTLGFGRANGAEQRLALGALQKLAQSSASYSQRLRNQHCQQQGRSLHVWTAASTLKTRRLLSSVLHAASCAALNFEPDFAKTLADVRPASIVQQRATAASYAS